MDARTTEVTPTRIPQPSVAAQKELDEARRLLAEIDRKQELIDQEFVYFEKCPVRYVVTKDDNGNELKGFKDKIKSTIQEHYNTLNKLTATHDVLLYESIVVSAVSAQPKQQKEDRSINIANQVLADYEPRDSLEAKLCLQAHILYTQGMEYINKAEHSGMLQQRELHIKNAMKLLRLHNETVEALSKYRRGGTQNVVVQHVQVNDGGKAVVGGVFDGGGGNKN